MSQGNSHENYRNSIIDRISVEVLDGRYSFELNSEEDVLQFRDLIKQMLKEQLSDLQQSGEIGLYLGDRSSVEEVEQSIIQGALMQLLPEEGLRISRMSESQSADINTRVSNLENSNVHDIEESIRIKRSNVLKKLRLLSPENRRRVARDLFEKTFNKDQLQAVIVQQAKRYPSDKIRVKKSLQAKVSHLISDRESGGHVISLFDIEDRYHHQSVDASNQFSQLPSRIDTLQAASSHEYRNYNRDIALLNNAMSDQPFLDFFDQSSNNANVIRAFLDNVPLETLLSKLEDYKDINLYDSRWEIYPDTGITGKEQDPVENLKLFKAYVNRRKKQEPIRSLSTNLLKVCLREIEQKSKVQRQELLSKYGFTGIDELKILLQKRENRKYIDSLSVEDLHKTYQAARRANNSDLWIALCGFESRDQANEYVEQKALNRTETTLDIFDVNPLSEIVRTYDNIQKYGQSHVDEWITHIGFSDQEEFFEKLERKEKNLRSLSLKIEPFQLLQEFETAKSQGEDVATDWLVNHGYKSEFEFKMNCEQRLESLRSRFMRMPLTVIKKAQLTNEAKGETTFIQFLNTNGFKSKEEFQGLLLKNKSERRQSFFLKYSIAEIEQKVNVLTSTNSKPQEWLINSGFENIRHLVIELNQKKALREIQVQKRAVVASKGEGIHTR